MSAGKKNPRHTGDGLRVAGRAEQEVVGDREQVTARSRARARVGEHPRAGAGTPGGEQSVHVVFAADIGHARPVDMVDEQMEYYRQRAGEYDQWWFRRGRYALPPDAERRWFADVAEVRGALDRFQPAGDVLEYACGTGLWTRQLVHHARRVTAVDSAAEMIALNRERVASPTVHYVRADIFTWTPPPAGFDVVFFGYWLSHVPAGRWTPFWTTVAGALRPGGRVFLVDSYHSTPVDGDTQQRVLNDGRRFSVVKRFWQPAELVAAAHAVGWRLTVSVTANEGILHASGTPA